jgi:hypothetical protein
MLARDVGHVLEQHGYPPVNGDDRQDLMARLWDFIYVARGVLGDVEARLNSVAAPLRTYTAPGALSSADCIATAHELRRLKDARLVVVTALGEDDVLHLGSSADDTPAVGAATERIMEAIEGVASPHAQVVESHTYVVGERGAAS